MPLTERQEKELAQAAGAVAQLAEMLGQLVEAVQLYERGHDDVAAPVLLRPILDSLMSEFEATARLKESTSGSRVRGTPYLATRYCPPVYSETLSVVPSTTLVPGGSVFVTSRRRGLELHIRVCDTGVGIRPDALSKIFNAFERDDQSRPEGLGLGLFIVKRAADLLGHALQCDRSKDRVRHRMRKSGRSLPIETGC